MTKTPTTLETIRHDAQALHQKISANIAKAEQASWADVEALQAGITELADKMKSVAGDQADEAKADIGSAISKLEAAGKLIENRTVAAKDGVHHANSAMLESAHTAAQSLSKPVAAARTRMAQAIEPKKVIA